MVYRFASDAEAWAELDQLLDQALDLPAPQRAGWIEALAPRFDVLKPRLQRLLLRGPGVETGDFLDRLPQFEASDWVPPGARVDQPGDLVGPYRLVRELGVGGMGTVWLAVRTDGLINRPVALKLPHGAWKRAGLAERLSREREILATLNHPNVARLYDAGLTPDGQPYLALEYVDGRPLDEYCRDRQLDVRSRLELFAQVAAAVAYAHGKLIVHRDLKPSNVLVTTDGQVRLLDFGIAKLLEDDRTRETRLTEISGRALTPDYASPEQILGEPLTVASDVYSLGVMLYELLSGTRPYRLKRDSRGALEDAIVQADPAPPSSVVGGKTGKALRGDLDTIILKALTKKPDERYPTVHALLDDIERHRSGRAVLAQPVGVGYRIRKFVGRNRLAVGAGIATVAAILIGASAALWQARVALAEKARADEVKEFIASVFREADPLQGEGKVLTAVELLRQAERRLQNRGETDPGLQLELLAILGESLFGLQETQDAVRVIEQAQRVQSTMATRDALLDARMHLILSRAFELQGRTDQARDEVEQTLAVLAASGHGADPLMAQAKLQLAALGIVVADYELAERAAHEAIEVATATLGARSAEVAGGLQRLSHVYTLTQRRQEALEPAQRAFEIMLELHARDRNHPAVLEAALYYGQALSVVGDFDAAYEVYQDATARTAGVFGDSSVTYGELLSGAIPLEIEVGELRAAIAHAQRAIEIYLGYGEPGSNAHAGRVRKLGNALLATRAGQPSVDALNEAIRLAMASDSKLEALHARGSLGLALAYQGKFDEGNEQLRLAIDGSGASSARAHHLASRNLGALLRLQGRHAEALPWLDKAIAAASVQHSHRGDLAYGLLEAGLAQLELGQPDAAQRYFDRADLLYNELQKGRMTPARADLLVGMARVRMANMDHAAALRMLERADEFWRGFDPENRWAGEAALWLGRCYVALGRRADADASLERAESILVRSPIPADTRLVKLARSR